MSELPTAAFIDTSVVVRYLTNDPPAMAEAAASLIDGEHPLILSEIVLAETAYVLSSVYEIPRATVVDALSAFIQRHNIRLLNISKPLALQALRLCRNSKRYSFADALLWAEASQGSVRQIYTFDERFPDHGTGSARTRLAVDRPNDARMRARTRSAVPLRSRRQDPTIRSRATASSRW